MKNLKLNIFTVAMLAVVFLAGCNGGPFCMHPKGSNVTQTVVLEDFDGIELDIDGDVTIHKGEAQEVKITGAQNIIDNIERNVVGGVWKIRYDECVRNSGNLEIDITIPDLRLVSIAGSGNVTSNDSFAGGSKLEVSIAGSGNIDILCSATTVETSIAGSGNIHLYTIGTTVKSSIAGSGDITLSGGCTDFNVDIAGSGNVHAYDLPGHNGDVSISGSGDCEINCSETLDVSISGSGSVRYKGTPQVELHVSGSGTVTHVD